MNIRELNIKELTDLIKENSQIINSQLCEEALIQKQKYYQDKIYARGLIEFTNICKNNCFYCGLRGDNSKLTRYRLSKEEILSCCEEGHRLGFSTFVLQGGEDMHFTDDVMCDIIYSIKQKYPDCAVTLSIGEKTKQSYKSYKSAGADRFLLRHETADDLHYKKLHPKNMSLEARKKCLYTLKELGFQTGAGFMVGSPHQEFEHLAKDLLFLKELEPEMVGIGPFLPHCDTPFANKKGGSFELTITMIALTRLMLPKVLLPATTALATLRPDDGRRAAFFAGANIVMPNLSPKEHREEYSLYNNKLSLGNEAAEGIKILERQIKECGFTLDMSRGDNVDFVNKN